MGAVESTGKMAQEKVENTGMTAQAAMGEKMESTGNMRARR